MAAALDFATLLLLGFGCFVALVSGVGALRLPDFYTRLHAAGKTDSFAQLLILAGLMLQAGDAAVAVKLAMIGLFFLLTAPSSTYAIARAAYLDGKVPWTKPPAAEPAPQAPKAKPAEGGAA